MFPRTLLALFAFSLAAERLPAQTAAPQVTATFWNVQWFPGRRPNASRSEENRQILAVHSDLGQLNSDVLGLEEVRDWEHAVLAVKPLSGFKVDVISNFPPREGQNQA